MCVCMCVLVHAMQITGINSTIEGRGGEGRERGGEGEGRER